MGKDPSKIKKSIQDKLKERVLLSQLLDGKLRQYTQPTMDRVSNIGSVTGSALSNLGTQSGQPANFGAAIGGGALQGLSAGSQFGLLGMLGGALIGGATGMAKAGKAQGIYDQESSAFMDNNIKSKTVEPLASFKEGGDTSKGKKGSGKTNKGVIGNRLDIPKTAVREYLIKETGIPERAFDNLLWFTIDHETGGTRSTTKKEGKDGGGVGLMQFQPKSIPTLVNRLETFYENQGGEFPEIFSKLRDGKAKLEDLTHEEQLDLGLAEFLRKKEGDKNERGEPINFRVEPDYDLLSPDKDYTKRSTYADIWFNGINKSRVKARRKKFLDDLNKVPDEFFTAEPDVELDFIPSAPLDSLSKQVPLLAMGGVAPSMPIQTEVGETIILPDGKLSEVKASKKHDDLPDDEVTDIVPENSFIFSNDKMLNIRPKDMMDEKVFSSPAGYSKDTLNLPVIEKIGDFFGKKKDTPANLSKKVMSKIKTKDGEDLDFISSITDRENSETRLPYLNILAQFQEVQKDEPDVDEGGVPQFAAGGLMMAMQAINAMESRNEDSKDEDLDRYRKLDKQQRGLAVASLFNNLATAAFQDPSVDPVIRETSYLNEAFRPIPLSITDQQADNIMRPVNSLGRNLINSGVNPNQIPSLLGKSLEQGLNAQSDFRLKSLMDRNAQRRGLFAARGQVGDANNAARVGAANQSRANQNQLVSMVGGANQGFFNNLASTNDNYAANMGTVMGGYNTNMNAIDQARMELDILREQFLGGNTPTPTTTKSNVVPPKSKANFSGGLGGLGTTTNRSTYNNLGRFGYNFDEGLF